MKKSRDVVVSLALVMVLISACAFRAQPTPSAAPSVSVDLATARSKIKHIIIIMQENRSFDHYFGTFPGADGIPMKNGVPTVCVTDPQTGKCLVPYHDPSDINYGGPHSAAYATMAIDGGKMDGFIQAVLKSRQTTCSDPNAPGCTSSTQGPDVMGYHDAREIPNYWAYAQNYILQDHMFEPNASWSLPAHLFMVSGWSAKCTNPLDPMSCTDALDNPQQRLVPGGTGAFYSWTDLTYLLHKANVSWAYYLSKGIEPDCADGEMSCGQVTQTLTVPGIWNPLPNFTTVHQDNQLGNIQPVTDFYKAAADGILPAVSWIVPEGQISEHPPASVHAGQAYVTGLVNAVMQGPDWESTVILLAWDDRGGFYDHIVPPSVAENGYGLRVPGLVISAYARKGFIDH